MGTSGGDASCPTGYNERRNIIIHKMVRADLIDSNKPENKWWCAE